VDHLEGTGIGIVDAALLGCQRMLDQLVLDALVGERACRVESEALKIARQHLHRRHAAGLDRLDELGPRYEWKICAAPQSEALSVGEVVHRRGAGSRYIDYACVGQHVL
jgi:hypothetical protein